MGCGIGGDGWGGGVGGLALMVLEWGRDGGKGRGEREGSMYLRARMRVSVPALGYLGLREFHVSDDILRLWVMTVHCLDWVGVEPDSAVL